MMMTARCTIVYHLICYSFLFLYFFFLFVVYYLNLVLFIVEADVQPDGSRVDRGLYILKLVDGEAEATKILDNGRDAATSGPGDNSTKAFFGAKDGLYVYNPETNSADKYGPITDSIIAIDMEKLGEVIYILTEDRDVYKVTDNGEKKEKLDDVVKPKQIVLDYQNNLYFFSDDKILYVRTTDGVKKIEGLPVATGSVILLKSPIFLENGALVIIDNKVYLIYSNRRSAFIGIELQPKEMPTALAIEAFLFQYYAHDKKIYEYNFLGAVDKKENVFYECESKYIKMLLKGFQEAIEFVGIPKNSARAIAIDPHGRAILAANDGLYWLRPDSLIPRKLMDLDFVPSGIAFYDNSILLSTSGVIYEFSGNCKN
nr:uncharacterized protein LOC117993944 [Maniola hyperantus]